MEDRKRRLTYAVGPSVLGCPLVGATRSNRGAIPLALVCLTTGGGQPRRDLAVLFGLCGSARGVPQVLNPSIIIYGSNVGLWVL